jgi:Ca2+/Na+ antiporter
MGLSPAYLLLTGCGLLLLATQLVVVVLSTLEKRDFGAVQLGTVVTPLCTGFPNLMIGLFGQERLQGDLVIQLNVGNNIANATLVSGLIILLAGPLLVRAKGTSKKAVAANVGLMKALAFLWLGAALLVIVLADGVVSRWDGLLLTAVYVVYQIITLRGRGKVTKKKRLGAWMALALALLLVAAAFAIQTSLDLIGAAMDELGGTLPGWQLGMFLGLLTVLPESFLMLRLAWRQGNLGVSGLVGDCLVSIPLVIGLSALLRPITTAAPQSLTDPAARPYLLLGVSMLALTLLPLLARKAVPRRIGIAFVLGYGVIWWLTAMTP